MKYISAKTIDRKNLIPMAPIEYKGWFSFFLPVPTINTTSEIEVIAGNSRQGSNRSIKVN